MSTYSVVTIISAAIASAPTGAPRTMSSWAVILYCGAMPAAPFDCDVLVVGGGPAGSTAASWLARAGRRVILLERDQFPPVHLGQAPPPSVNHPLRANGPAAPLR